ncbi:MAG: hypothetical protein MK132_05230 [Lentisphaerales bacterium]|nr:hypothetical protein [Lentisphaerales bacterium]
MNLFGASPRGIGLIGCDASIEELNPTKIKRKADSELPLLNRPQAFTHEL